MANDPHLESQIPGHWYPCRLVWKGGKASGVTFFGIPSIIIGKTEHLAVGITASTIDATDLYSLETKGNYYKWEGKWRRMREYKEKLHVRGKAEPLEVSFYGTHHGVVLDYYMPEFFSGRGFQFT